MSLKPSAQRVQDLLRSLGSQAAVVEMPDSTRTAGDAAAACGCTVAQIAKSLLFRAKDSGRPVLVVASGVNWVDEKAVGRLIGEKIGRADADFVRETTGFAIGGVPPIGHATAPVVVLDEDLFALDPIWCAAGTPNAVFSTTATELERLTGGQRAAIRKG